MEELNKKKGLHGAIQLGSAICILAAFVSVIIFTLGKVEMLET
jgi:hypothetical protein